jgi:hypothetical protein
LLRGMAAKQVPVIISGEFQGTQITCYVMQKNFVGWTDFIEPGQGRFKIQHNELTIVGGLGQSWDVEDAVKIINSKKFALQGCERSYGILQGRSYGMY